MMSRLLHNFLSRTANGCFISFVPSIRIGDDGNVSFGPSPFMSGEDTPTVSLTGLAYGNEFEYIATATRRRKLAERRAARKKKARENLLEYDEKKDEEFNHENGYGGVDGGDDESNDGGDFQFNAEVDCDADRLGDSAPGGNISADAFEQVFSHVGDGINSGQGERYLSSKWMNKVGL